MQSDSIDLKSKLHYLPAEKCLRLCRKSRDENQSPQYAAVQSGCETVARDAPRQNLADLAPYQSPLLAVLNPPPQG